MSTNLILLSIAPLFLLALYWVIGIILVKCIQWSIVLRTVSREFFQGFFVISLDILQFAFTGSDSPPHSPDLNTKAFTLGIIVGFVVWLGYAIWGIVGGCILIDRWI